MTTPHDPFERQRNDMRQLVGNIGQQFIQVDGTKVVLRTWGRFREGDPPEVIESDYVRYDDPDLTRRVRDYIDNRLPYYRELLAARLSHFGTQPLDTSRSRKKSTQPEGDGDAVLDDTTRPNSEGARPHNDDPGQAAYVHAVKDAQSRESVGRADQLRVATPATDADSDPW